MIENDKQLPRDITMKLYEFVEWLDEKYETKNGTRALFYALSDQLSNEIKGGRP